MNEFNKPFEYFEEKGAGGILLILFFMLITVEPILGILAIFVGLDMLKEALFLKNIFIIATILFIIFSIFTAVVIKTLRRTAVVTALIFFAYRVLYLTPVLILNMKRLISLIPYEKTYHLYAQEYDGAVNSLVLGIAYVLVFSAGWAVYLLLSKKVRTLYPGRSRSSSAGTSMK